MSFLEKRSEVLRENCIFRTFHLLSQAEQFPSRYLLLASTEFTKFKYTWLNFQTRFPRTTESEMKEIQIHSLFSISEHPVWINLVKSYYIVQHDFNLTFTRRYSRLTLELPKWSKWLIIFFFRYITDAKQCIFTGLNDVLQNARIKVCVFYCISIFFFFHFNISDENFMLQSLVVPVLISRPLLCQRYPSRITIRRSTSVRSRHYVWKMTTKK